MTAASISDVRLSRNPLFSFLDRQGPLLTAEQEQLLARKARRGCMRSRNELVERNLRLAIELARRSKPRDEHDLMDRIQAGSTGLIRAAEKFDPDRGFRFSTYATWWVRQAISREREHAPSEVDRDGERVLSLDVPLTADGTATRGDMLIDDAAEDPAEVAERMDLKEQIEQHLRTLAPPARHAVRLRFGLETGAPETIQSIAKHMRIDPLDARRVTFHALRELQAGAEVEAREAVLA